MAGIWLELEQVEVYRSGTGRFRQMIPSLPGLRREKSVLISPVGGRRTSRDEVGECHVDIGQKRDR
jgi:hypothetical protein